MADFGQKAMGVFTHSLLVFREKVPNVPNVPEYAFFVFSSVGAYYRL